GWREVEGGQAFRRNLERLHHEAEDLRGMQVGIEQQAVSHEVAAVWAASAEGVEADPARRAAEIGEGRRGASEELEVDRGGDAKPAQPAKRDHGVAEGDERAVRSDGQDIVPRDQPDHVEDGTVLGEYHEEHLVASDQLDGTADGGVREDRRALLRQLDEGDPTGAHGGPAASQV